MINIVTPTTRVENLQRIAASLLNNYHVKWWVILDKSVDLDLNPHIIVPTNVTLQLVASNENAVAGHLHRNFVLNQLHDEDWFYSVDDDNILHPDFLQELTDDRSAVIVAQAHKDDSIRLNANPPQVNYIDTAQFAIRKSLIGSIRFEDVYHADGIFATQVYSQNPDKFTIINKPLSYYNYLRP